MLKREIFCIFFLGIVFFLSGCGDKDASRERFEKGCVESFLSDDGFKDAPLKNSELFLEETCRCAGKEFEKLPSKSRKEINDFLFSEKTLLRENNMTKPVVKSIADCMLQTALNE